MPELLIVNPGRDRHDNISLALRVLVANEGRYDLTGSAVRHIAYNVSGRSVGMSNLAGWTKAGWTTGFRGQLGKLWEYVEPRTKTWVEPVLFNGAYSRFVDQTHVIGKCSCVPCFAHEQANQARGARTYRWVRLTEDGRVRYHQRCALSGEELLAYGADAWLPNAQRYRRPARERAQTKKAKR